LSNDSISDQGLSSNLRQDNYPRLRCSQNLHKTPKSSLLDQLRLLFELGIIFVMSMHHLQGDPFEAGVLGGLFIMDLPGCYKVAPSVSSPRPNPSEYFNNDHRLKGFLNTPLYANH
jgi:hypothetical protein